MMHTSKRDHMTNTIIDEQFLDELLFNTTTPKYDSCNTTNKQSPDGKKVSEKTKPKTKVLALKVRQDQYQYCITLVEKGIFFTVGEVVRHALTFYYLEKQLYDEKLNFIEKPSTQKMRSLSVKVPMPFANAFLSKPNRSRFIRNVLDVMFEKYPLLEDLL